LFNATPQGPFTEATVNYGSNLNPVPFGNYVVQITDACGRIATSELLIEFELPQPSAGAYNNGCFSLFGRINIAVPTTKIVSATITAAPSTYTATLPQDVSSSITIQGELNLYNMPLGTYTITFTDNCGFTYQKTLTVPPFVEKDFFLVTLPACDAGFGTVRYQSGNGDLTQVTITAAPSSFGQSLPLDVSSNIIADGDFYMGSLPEGNYTFSATDVCGIVKIRTIFVEGYHPPQDPYLYVANCGSFSVKVTDGSNGTEGVSYWLQKYYPETNTWGHLSTAAVYTEGTIPTGTNSTKLTNFTFMNNLNFTGKFRVIKKFETFSNASSANTMCISVMGEFTYEDGLSINTAYTLACVGSPNDVMLEITGQPTSFKIIEKNGQPYFFDNGTSNIFVNVDPAEYVFQIENDCGDIVTQGFNVLTLPSIADASQPDDMVLCVENGTAATYQYHLTDQNAGVLGPLYSAMYTITYHLTFEDADTGVNALPEYYTSTGNGQTIYARLIHNEISLCHGVTSFKLFVGEYQEPIIATSGTICNNSRLGLSANPGYSSYLWSTGETTQDIFVTEPGIYTVIVEKNYGTTSCDGYAEVEIKESVTPEIIKIESTDWTEDNNVITVHTQGAADLEYSLDGVNFQASNVFTGLGTGLFTIYVKDAHGCGQTSKEVVLLNYPNYFTPNGDGSHDMWNIKYASMEPHMKVVVMDRYGKIITAFGSTSRGWDGTLNGIQLPSTDYWFVVTREDGRELKGHFAMLR
jgi:gliding motility-associated-like protein